MATTIKWLDRPEDKDFVAAANYLGLLWPEARAEAIGRLCSTSPVSMHRVNDLLRASGLALLPADDPHVDKDLKKMQKGTAVSPVLVVRGNLDSPRPMVIADGYHRICASYHADTDAMVPCVLVDLD